jgi:predicted MFS family arabinose efflux permease
MSLLVAIGQVGYGVGGSIAGPFYVQSGYVSNTIIGTVMILVMAYVVWRHVPEPDLNSTS